MLRLNRSGKSQPKVLYVCGIALVVLMATVWEFRKGSKPVGWQKRNALFGHANPILAVAFSPDGQRLASGDQEGNVLIWEWDNTAPVAALHGDQQRILSLTFSPDGQTLVSGDTEGTVILWDMVQGKEKQTLYLHDAGVVGICYA